MQARKTIIFLGDGMADEPIEALGGRTPLQAAATPAMDRIAAEGCCGSLLTLPEGFPTSSDVANMSVLGCDLEREFCGRGPLEAAGRGIELAADDIAFRLNLVSVDENGMLQDFSGGHIGQSDAERLIARVQQALGRPGIRFCPGISYRNLLILSGPSFSDRVLTEKPDDNHGNPVGAHLPRAHNPEEDPRAEATAALLRELVSRASDVLADDALNRRARREGRLGANGIWPWSGGRAGAIRSLASRYGIRSAVISAVDVINGLGRCLGMDVIRVPGATGYIDTNYEGKADAAAHAIRDHDLVYVHVEAIDEVSHNQDLALKLQAIEDFDRRVVARAMSAVDHDVRLVVLPDHPVPVALGKHTRTPVPVAICDSAAPPDSVRTFDEQSCQAGSLGAMKGPALMERLFGCGGPTTRRIL